MFKVRLNLRKVVVIAICLASFTVFSFTCIAQDIVVTKDARRINAKVTEVNVDNIRYKNFDNQDGPVYTLLKSDIASIIYQNGQVETFVTESPKTVAPVQTATTPTQTQIVNSGNLLADMQTHSPALYSRYKSGKRMAITSGVLTGIGVGSAVIGAIIFGSGDEEAGTRYVMEDVGGAFIIIGSLSAITGVPILIVGASKKNNAVRNFNRQYYSSEAVPQFQFNMYPNRIGLAYVF